MHLFQQRFTIHPVGQGLFYSCNIIHDNQIKFRMVLDCGSNTANACQEEVKEYRDNDYIKQKNLDLLVISHFDSDHVKYIELLLQGGIKVKRLVMPLITFEERLFLVARHLGKSNGYKTEDEFVIRFIIDPIGAISDNLDDDSETFFIDSNPKTPIPPNNQESVENNEGPNNETRFIFDFDFAAKENIDLERFSTLPTKGKVWKVKDTNKGKLNSSIRVNKLMEFLFYKREIGTNEVVFFKEVEKLFIKEFSVDNVLLKKEKVQAIINVVKGIKSSARIKPIFKIAADNVSLTPSKRLKIDDLNTTALCLLHRNLKGIFEFLGINYNDYIEYHYFYFGNVKHIQKFRSTSSRIETIWSPVNGYHRLYTKWLNKSLFFYPNVMLTSDTFLLSEE